MSKLRKCTTHCFRCDKEMEVHRDEDGFMFEMISDGLFFHADGNYGSCIFDPIVRRKKDFLEIVICDDCVESNSNKVDHVRLKFQPQHHIVGPFEVDTE